MVSDHGRLRHPKKTHSEPAELQRGNVDVGIERLP